MDTQTLKLTLPARPEFLGTIRLLASSVASSADMDIDDVDDLRIAADELCYLLMSSSVGSPELELVFSISSNHLVISGRRGDWPKGETPPTPSDLMVKILSKVVDTFEISATSGALVFSATKDAGSSSPATAAVSD